DASGAWLWRSDGTEAGTVRVFDNPEAIFSGIAPILAPHIANFAGSEYDDVLFQSDVDGQLVFATMRNGNFSGFAVATGSLPGSWVVGGHGDVNGDGFADIVVQNSASGSISIASEHGTGTPTWLSVGSTPGWAVRGVGDVTGDGFADIVIQSQSSGQIVFGSMAHGSFS